MNQPLPAPTLSFEFFPPRNDAQSRRLWRTFGRLEALSPAWVSVTYGALGSASQASLETVACIRKETQVPVAAHLTCSGQTRQQIGEVLDHLGNLGVERIVALRGDAIAGETDRAVQSQSASDHEPGSQPLRHANELVELITEHGGFDVSVAAYPEVHPEAAGSDDDLYWLQAKFEAGATRALTQFFFEADTFLRFRDRAAAFGIHHPIVPGILPIHDISKVVDFSRRCGASVSDALVARFSQTQEPASLEQLAVDQCLELCNTLQAEGVHDFHFYTLNQSRLATLVAERLTRDGEQRSDSEAFFRTDQQWRVAGGI